VGDPTINVPKEGIIKSLFIVKIPEKDITTMKTTIQVGVYQHGKKIMTRKARFIGPMPSTQLKK
jgi:hypothetical protein